MPNAKRILLENVCYHLITRGNQKQKVFMNRGDYLIYLSLLKRFKRKYKFLLYAYCLMPNHVHLVGEIENHLLLSNFMHDLNRTYTLYFNNKHGKVGHLWQGRFKNRVIAKDRYLIDCINYVEANPLRSDLVKEIPQYQWSSYNGRVLGRGDKIIDLICAL